MDKILKIASGIKLPLSISALGLLILYLLFDSIVSMGIFSNLSEGNTFEIIQLLLSFVFWIAVLALICGAFLYALPYVLPRYKTSKVDIVSSELNVNLSSVEPEDVNKRDGNT